MVSNTHHKESSGVVTHRELLKMLRTFFLKEDYTVTTKFLTVLPQMFAAGCCHRLGAGSASRTIPVMKYNNTPTAKDTRLVCVTDTSSSWAGVSLFFPSSSFLSFLSHEERCIRDLNFVLAYCRSFQLTLTYGFH